MQKTLYPTLDSPDLTRLGAQIADLLAAVARLREQPPAVPASAAVPATPAHTVLQAPASPAVPAVDPATPALALACARCGKPKRHSNCGVRLGSDHGRLTKLGVVWKRR